MPINNKYSIDELLKACRDYGEKTGRRVSFEYTLIKGVNDTKECAMELCNKLKGTLCHVNLIPVNDVKERNNIRSSKDDIIKFANILKRNGINATIRRTLGSDINASCGQLRRMKNRGEIVENSCKD
jgi:23S rRNA (adenine2503-C2)-methyltransferase